jgi:hypothetical protein
MVWYVLLWPVRPEIHFKFVEACVKLEKRRLLRQTRKTPTLTLKCAQKKVTDFGYPRAYRFRKHQIENRFPELALPTFFKTWFLVHKMVLKLAKISKNWPKIEIFDFFSTVFHKKFLQNESHVLLDTLYIDPPWRIVCWDHHLIKIEKLFSVIRH